MLQTFPQGRVPHSSLCSWHKPSICPDGRHEGGADQDRSGRHHRHGGREGEGGAAQGQPGLPDDHLPQHQRRV